MLYLVVVTKSVALQTSPSLEKEIPHGFCYRDGHCFLIHRYKGCFFNRMYIEEFEAKVKRIHLSEKFPYIARFWPLTEIYGG